MGKFSTRRRLGFCVVGGWRDVDKDSRPAYRGIITTAQRRFVVLKLDDVNRSYDKRRTILIADDDHPDPLSDFVPLIKISCLLLRT